MVKAKFVHLIMLLSCVIIQAENVSITGIVKKTGTTSGVAGAKITLAKKGSLSVTTDADGKFSLSGSTAIQQIQPEVPSFHFNLQGNCIVFSPLSGDIAGNLEIFSSNGKKVFSADLSEMSGIRSVTLPALSSGVNLMRLTAGGESISRTLVCMGNELLLEGGSMDANVLGNFAVMKQAAAAVVDTLVVSKTGYTTKKITIDSYTKDNMAIELDSVTGTGKCTRESLKELVNGYVAALEAADPTKMTLADNAKYSENMKISSLGEGIWKTNLKVNFHRDFFDVDSCKIYTEIIDNLSSHPYNIGAQIRVANGKITEISALVADSGDWAISKKSDLTTMYNISSKEAWTIIPAEKRDTRATIKAAGDAYLDLFNNDKTSVPWGTPCARLEGAMYTGNKNNLNDPNQSCNVGVPSGVEINSRIYIIDVDMGTVSIFCKFGGAMPDSHLFRVENGKLRFVHTISIQGK